MPADAPETAPAPPWRIGVDVGGTFTDLVLADAAGRIRVFKAPSTPADPAQGVLDALARAADRLALGGVDALLAQCDLFVHGSTVATNTALEHKGAKAGPPPAAGLRDSLETGRPPRRHTEGQHV